MSEEINTGSEGISDSELQSQMSDNLSDAWLDPSVNAYQDGKGNLLELNGNWVKTPEDLAKYKEQQKTQNATNPNTAQQPAEQQKNANNNAQQQPAKQTSKVFEKFRDFKYTPPVQRQVVQQPVQPQTPQEPAKKDVQTSLAEFRAQQEGALKPYVAAINALQRAGVYTVDNPQAVELSEAYEALKSEIDGKVHNKYSELLKEELSGVTKAAEAKELKVAADRAFLNVAADVGGPDVLNALLVGQQAGKDFIRGPGANLIESFFYAANPQAKGTDQEMQEWWIKHSSYEPNIRVLADYAMAKKDQLDYNKNLEKAVNQVREQTTQQVKQKQKFFKSTPQGGFRPKTTISSEQQQVRAWAGDTV